jgi:hypothetical protein
MLTFGLTWQQQSDGWAKTGRQRRPRALPLHCHPSPPPASGWQGPACPTCSLCRCPLSTCPASKPFTSALRAARRRHSCRPDRSLHPQKTRGPGCQSAAPPHVRPRPQPAPRETRTGARTSRPTCCSAACARACPPQCAAPPAGPPAAGAVLAGRTSETDHGCRGRAASAGASSTSTAAGQHGQTLPAASTGQTGAKAQPPGSEQVPDALGSGQGSCRPGRTCWCQ